MIKIIAPIVLFIIIIYVISNYWIKSNIKKRKKIAATLGVLLVSLLVATTYFVIN